MDTIADAPRVFAARQKVGWQAASFIVGGVVFFAAMALWFVALVKAPSKPGDEYIPGLMGGVSVVGVGLLARGFFLLRTTRRVIFDATGIHVESSLARRTVRWGDIQRIDREKQSGLFGEASREVLKIIGTSGKTLTTLTDTLGGFEALAADISARSSAAAGHATFDPAENEYQRLSRASRKSKIHALCFGLFTLGMIGGLCAGINEELHLRRFASEGIRVDAKIVRRWMVSVTPHLQYSFKDDQGQSHATETMMFQGAAWDALDGAETVPIEYLRSDPTWSRLLAGEDAGVSFGGKVILLCVAGILMFGTFFVMSLLGLDIDTADGVTTITRHGRVIKTFGQT